MPNRDLKPQNIMIDKDGNALIMDFGIARSVESDGFTDDGAMIGTPSYISPEQLDANSDISSILDEVASRGKDRMNFFRLIIRIN